MQVAKSTVGVGVKVLESGEKLIKKQVQNGINSGKNIFHSSPNASPKFGSLRETPSPNVPPEDTKAECICTYKKDLGKLIVTEKYLKFRSLHYDEIIHFDKVSSIRKKGPQKVVLKMKDDSTCSFGPFDDVRRGVIHDIIRTIYETYTNKKEAGGKGGGININAIPGLNDQLVKDLFDKPNIPEIVPGTFKEPSEIDTVCIDEVFDIPLKNLFALVMTDSSTFLNDLQTKQGDSGITFTKWEYSEANACYTRQFDFIKKNKLATATVHQTQLCRLKTPTEILFETSNKMEGVPFADSFTVDTKWRLAQEGEKTRIRVWCRVDFKKSVSFIKGKIESGSISGTQDYFKDYTDFLRKTLSSGDGTVEEEKEAPGTNKSKGSSSVGMYITITAMLLLIPLGLYYLWGFFSYVNIQTPNEIEVDIAQVIEELLKKVQEQLAEHKQLALPLEGFPSDPTIETLVGLQDSLIAQLETTSDLLANINNYLTAVAKQAALQ